MLCKRLDTCNPSSTLLFNEDENPSTLKGNLPVGIWDAQPYNEQLMDKVGHDITNYQWQGLSYGWKPKAEAGSTYMRFVNL